MPLKTLIALSLGIATWLTAGAEVAPAQALRYAVEPGATHTYVRTQQDHVTQTVNGAEQKAEVRSYWRFGATIGEAEGGGRTVEVVHDSLTIETTPQPATSFSALYGKPVRIAMNERGTVTEVVVPDSVPDTAARLDLAATYRGFYPVLPADPVEEGHTWSDTVNVKTTQSGLDMTIRRVNHYTARGTAEYADREGLKVDYTTEVSIEGSGTQQGADISLSGQGTGTGSFYFQPEPGLYLGGTETSEVKMDAFVVAGEQNLLIPIVQQREETIELVD
jgi:hypothetical protein